ncbi:MAG: hypothetical protein AB7G39_00310 [Alphaproteobacteria bacterium]
MAKETGSSSRRRLRRQPATKRLAAISDLSSRLTHDFNNVLAAVVGHLELIERRLEGSPDAQARLHKAITAALQGRAVAQKLAVFSAPRVDEPRAMSINAVARRVCERVRALGRTVEQHGSASDGPVLGDERRLEAALVALTLAASGNAGPVSITVGNHPGRQRKQAWIAVAGPGLTPPPEGPDDDGFRTLALDSAALFAEAFGGQVQFGIAEGAPHPECRLVLPLQNDGIAEA